MEREIVYRDEDGQRERERARRRDRGGKRDKSERRRRERNARMKALRKRSVGGGGDLRQRIKVGLKCRND